MKGNELLLKLKADNKELKAKLAKTEGDLARFSKKAESVGSRVGASMRNMGMMIVAYIGVQAVRSLVNLASKMSSVETAFRGLAAGVQDGSDALLRSIQTASRGTLSQLQIMESSNLALQLMGEQVAQHLPKMAEIALATARATGRSVADAYQDLIVATGRQSIMVLDNLGISSATAALKMEEYARSIGKTRAQMTAAEKKQAFFYATMEAGQELMDRTNLATLTLGERVQILKSKLADAASTMSRKMIPALEELTTTMTTMDNSGTSFLDTLSKIGATAIIVFAMIIEGIKGIGPMFTAMGKMAKASFYDIASGFVETNAQMFRSLGITSMADRLSAKARELHSTYARLSRESRDADSSRRIRIAELEQKLKDIWAGRGAAEGTAGTRRITPPPPTTGGGGGGGGDRSSKDIEEEQKKNATMMSRIWGGIVDTIKAALSSIDQASRQLVYNMMWGEGGWNTFKKSIQSIMKQLVADITYAIARAIILQAILAGTTGGKGGLLAGSVIGGMFEKGRLPSFAKGRMPIFSMGNVPADHFPAFIGANEAVINARSTRANYPLLKQMNDNPGQVAGGVTVQQTNNITGNVLSNDYVDDYIIKRLEWNARMNGTKLFGDQSL